MTLGEPAEDRAERLRVLLSVSPWADDPGEATKHLSEGDWRTLDGLCQEDLDLANACLAVEVGIRARGFAAIEQLAAAIAQAPEPGATIEDRICALPDAAFRSAARLVLDLRWID